MKIFFKFGVIFSLCLSTAHANDTEIGLAIRDFGGTKKASLAPCPSSPNCVTSMENPGTSKDKLMSSLTGPSKSISYSKIKFILTQDGAEIVKQLDNYIHAIYESPIFGFVDDVEFYFPTQETIHFRSASRTGYSDLGVNKRRMTRIKHKFQQTRN